MRIKKGKIKQHRDLKNPAAVFLSVLAERVEAGEVVGVLGLYINGKFEGAAFCMGDFSIDQIRAAVNKMGHDFEEMIAGREIGSEVLS